ncbi:MAG: DUF3737 family protein [Clostridiales bacterium]|nr:DUF3737 family protein [Clostridiales bacterium]
MEKIKGQQLSGERSLFASKELYIEDCLFIDGESPLKESRDLELFKSTFNWKYPLWYCRNVKVENCKLTETGRAGIWYTHNITMRDCNIEAPKTFRRASGITLENITMPNALETLWWCKNVTIKNLTAKGDYLAMNCENMQIDNLELLGNYAFDGAKNIEIRNSKLMTKDAFWNAENITVYNSHIKGEYLGWNSKNLTFIDCTLESLQGLCYIENLVLKNCKLINTTLAFEYSTVDAEIIGGVDSVLNPSGGRITADFIGELIIEKDKVDPEKTRIICRKGK